MLFCVFCRILMLEAISFLSVFQLSVKICLSVCLFSFCLPSVLSVCLSASLLSLAVLRTVYPCFTVCPGNSDPFYIASILYKMGH